MESGDNQWMLSYDAIGIQDERIRHADTQAGGLMALTATAVGLLSADAGSELGSLAKVVVPAMLVLTFLCALIARLSDTWLKLAPRQGKNQTRGSAEHIEWLDDETGRKHVAKRKATLIGWSLFFLGVAVIVAGFDAAL